ncbi:uncharacterized protein LOC116917407 [Daphnia magna]|uniref:uncharacterized protein LOC116917407 n=1 Tax=Daphnia magna TaxID=35525 RepID=UPI001E1BA168|nr:uncharacterized protein LOC116917407 [Daphnia magna]
MYVDDYLGSARSADEGVAEASTVRKALAGADLHFQDWISNSAEFVAAMQEEKKPIPQISSLSTDSESTKVLGVVWNTTSDALGFQINRSTEEEYTRLSLTSHVAGIFDPLGLAAPIIIKAKVRLRDLVVKGLKWSDPEEGADRAWWESWFQIVQELAHVSIERCLFPEEDDIVESQLHTFGDASEEAYATVVYIRNQYRCGKIIIRIVKASSKLAPKKSLSVPKLELNAALLSARVAATVQNCLTHSIDHRYFWTDSSTVRNWIRATASFYQIFVANRVGEIQTLTESDEWRFIPGKLNPADAATRSAIGEEVWPKIWQDGPEFLLQPESTWPTDLPWMATTFEIKAIKLYSVQSNPDPFGWSAVGLDCSNLSSFLKLEGETKNLLKRCQSEAFPEDIARLKRGKPLRSSSHLLVLSPTLDEDGILRLGGRIDRAKLPYDARHPPLLPSKHPLTEKIVEVVHGQMHHAGTDNLFAKLCQHFWIIRGRELVKKVRRMCPTCIKERAVPAAQLMGNLPAVRLDSYSPPFFHTAVDYFGPIETNFLLVFRRFIGLFGKPATVHSDNGTNFVGTERELNDLVDQLEKDPRLSQFRKEKVIDWNFQPPRAPHFGGAHESLVRSTKRALYQALDLEKKALRYPTDEMLRTLFAEIAGFLNSRPLTYASSDPEDFRPLTPNDFLNRPPTFDLLPGKFSDALPRERFRYVQKMAQLFWDLWTKLYLPTLVPRKKWQSAQENLTVGDVVLLLDPNLPRGLWKIGHVNQVYPGGDGLVRVVKVKTEDGEYTRAIHRLSLLEKAVVADVHPEEPHPSLSK